MKFKILTLFLAIALIGVVSAGCCFDPAAGTCAENANEAACASYSGQYNPSECSSLSECDSGCCLMGVAAGFMTQQQCSVYSRAQGVPLDFRLIAEAECTTLSSFGTYGACVVDNAFATECYYVDGAQCAGGEFYSDTFCTDPSLGSLCSRTEDTICDQDGNVHYLDDCGNIEDIKESCDYGSGSICDIRSSTDAYCKNINCGYDEGASRQNGDRWCVSDDLIDVGSQAYKRYCIDGDIYTEACGDLRSEVCDQGNCIPNSPLECLDVNPDRTADNYNTSNVTWVDNCDTEKCNIVNFTEFMRLNFTNGSACNPSGGNMVTNVSPCNLNSNNYSTILMTDLGLDYCVPKITAGLEFWPDTVGGTYSSANDTVCANGNYNGLARFRKSNTRQPLIDLGSSSGSTHNQIIIEDKRLTASVDGISTYGGAGLISLIGSHWGYGDSNNIYCLSGNPVFGSGTSEWRLTSSNFWRVIVDVIKISSYTSGAAFSQVPQTLQQLFSWDVSTRDGKIIFSVDYTGCEGVTASSSVPIQQGVVPFLEERCLSLGDCAGSVNIVGENSSLAVQNISNLNCNATGGYFVCGFNYTCSPYRAPVGDNDCGICNNPNLPCSEYRCKSLGNKCDPVLVEGTNEIYCSSIDDYSPPIISSKVREYESSSWLQNVDATTFDYNDKIELEITTNEVSECKFNVGSSAGGDFGNVSNRVSDEYGMEHKLRLTYPNQAEIMDEFYEQAILGDSGSIELFIYCKDVRGNFNLGPHLIELNIGSPPDRTPPQMRAGSLIPAGGSFIPLNASIKDVRFRLNENGQCRWASQEMEYDTMNNSFLCIQDGCSGILPTPDQTNTFYIRCKDVSGNSNRASTIYTLTKAQSELIIESIYPHDLDIVDDHVSFDLEVYTSGGAGDEICEFKVDGYYDEYVEFLDKFGNKHVQPADLPIGSHIIRVYCQDPAGDSATSSQKIKKNQDIAPPLITRIYNRGNNLVLMTKDPSECAFDYYSCSQDFINMTSFIGTGLEHTTPSIEGKSYYIKCKDVLGNLPLNNACSRIVRA